MTRLDRGAVVAAAIAASLGSASAAMSAYWALGGTALLDTVDGEIERWGRERSAGVAATLWLITGATLVGAVAPLVLVGVGSGRLPAWTRARPMRVESGPLGSGTPVLRRRSRGVGDGGADPLDARRHLGPDGVVELDVAHRLGRAADGPVGGLVAQTDGLWSRRRSRRYRRRPP